MSRLDRVEILMEDMSGKMDAVLEYVRDIPEIKSRLTKVEDKLDGVGGRLAVVETVVKEHSRELTEIKSELGAVKTIVSTHSHEIAVLKSK